jgi:hypothetical protein
MPSNTTPIRLELSHEEREELEHRARSLAAPYRQVIRAKIVLLLADGATVSSVSRTVGRRRDVVRKWAWRFQNLRLAGLDDAPGRGRKARFSPGSRDVSDQAGLRAA